MVLFCFADRLPEVFQKYFSSYKKKEPFSNRQHGQRRVIFLLTKQKNRKSKYITPDRKNKKHHIKKIFENFPAKAEKQVFSIHSCQKGHKPFGNGGAADAESDVCKYKALGR